MGFRQIWPHGADHVVTTRATGEQLVRWYWGAQQSVMRPHLGLFLARAADHYVKHLQRRQNRMKKKLEGR